MSYSAVLISFSEPDMDMTVLWIGAYLSLANPVP